MLWAYSTVCVAWGPDGHSTVGILALAQLQAGAHQELAGFVKPLNAGAMVKACNWPDVIRETDAGAGTDTQHYINIPRGDFGYLKSRDCPTGQCATEAIKHYATRLAERDATAEQRWQAFAWLCHLTGDIHQPLHAGFADDRGGNNFDITYKGKATNLHSLWDFELINQHAGSWPVLLEILSTTPASMPATPWSEAMVDDWTNVSHQLARQSIYPVNNIIDDIYEQKSWELVQQRLRLAATRLAWIINSVLQHRD